MIQVTGKKSKPSNSLCKTIGTDLCNVVPLQGNMVRTIRISGFFQAEVHVELSKQLKTTVFGAKDTVSKSYWPVHKDCSQVTTAQDWSEMTDVPPT